MFFLATREIKFSKLRYALISFIILLIAFLVFIISGLANGLSMDNASSVYNMKANYFLVEKGIKQKIDRSSVPLDTQDQVEKLPYVKEASPLHMQMTTVTKNDEKEKYDATFFSVSAHSFLEPVRVEGKSYDQLTKTEAIVDSSLKKKGFKIGDTLHLNQTDVKVAGFTKDQTFSHTPVIFVPMDNWTTLFKNPTGQNSFNTIAVNVNKDDVKQLKKDVSTLEVASKDQVLNGMAGFKEEKGTLSMIVVFLYIIAAFVLAVFFYVVTLQKRAQFGMLKALGINNLYLIGNIIGQVTIITLISIGIAMGITLGLKNVLVQYLPFSLSTASAIQYSMVLLVVSVVGAFISLYQVIKVDAIEAIGRVE